MGLTIATLVLAGITAALVGVALLQALITHATLQQSLRPLLADPQPRPASDETELVQFPAPGRDSTMVPAGSFFYQSFSSDHLQVSVAFENIGAGVAAVVGARADPAEIPRGVGHSSVHISRKFVPVGALVRVNVSMDVGPEGFGRGWFGSAGLSVVIDYTDSAGRQFQSSRATIGEYVTQLPFVQEIEVIRPRRWRRPEIVRAKGTY